jgi:hypothetical protein
MLTAFPNKYSGRMKLNFLRVSRRTMFFVSPHYDPTTYAYITLPYRSPRPINNQLYHQLGRLLIEEWSIRLETEL